MSMRRWASSATGAYGGVRHLVKRLWVAVVVADQCLVSAAGFLSTILLARFLGVEGFGRLTLLWTVVFFANSLQFAAVIQPMMSVGPKQSEIDAPGYYGAVVLQQLLMSAVAFVVIVFGVEVTAIAAPEWGIRGLGIPLGVATFAGQAQDFLRRYLFVRYRPVAALTNDVIRYFGQVFLLFAANKLSGELTLSMALWVTAAGAMLGTGHGVLCLEKLRFNTRVLCHTLRRHWRLSKWLIPSTAMSWCTGNVFFLMAGVVLGAATVGVLRAAQTIVGVFNILLIAIDNFAPARASEILHRQGSVALHRYLKGLTWQLGSVLLLLMLLINVNPTAITRLVYGNQYPTMSYLVLGFSIIYLVPLLAKILHVWALAAEATDVEFVSWLVAVAVTAVTVYPFVNFGGLAGVFSGTFLVDALWAVITFCALRRNIGRRVPQCT
jgi:O-antigen/teichoic acid export membrane protein